MGSGKTTVGRALAALLTRDFADLDEMVASRYGTTVPQIFASVGESAFRKFEQETLHQLLISSSQPKILALGGGTFACTENVQALQAQGVVTVFLSAPPEVLYRRCVDSLDTPVRPLLKDLPAFKKLYMERLPFYQRAQWQIETSGRPALDVATEIASRLGLRSGGENRMVP